MVTLNHINRITGSNNAAAPLYSQGNSGEGEALVGLVSDGIGTFASHLTNPPALIFGQSVLMAVYIVEVAFNPAYALSTMTLGVIGLTIGLWIAFYTPLVSIFMKITMSFIYALWFYRVVIWAYPDLPVTGETFTIKYLASDVAISASTKLWVLTAIVMLITLTMQRRRGL